MKIYDDILREKPITPILDRINFPKDIKQLNNEELLQLADDLRAFLLFSVGQTGGHLGSNLGVVELTIALHYVFDTPNDKVVFDVGHQAYIHKILTGRKDKFASLRQFGGLAPFPDITESEFDSFTVGHSSTSISAGLGYALSNKLNKNNNHTIAVIGDASLSAGQAFEALNQGDTDIDMLVIINDNDMSISKNVGSLSKHLSKILTSKRYNKTRNIVKKVVRNLPFLYNLFDKTENYIKEIFTDNNIFEALHWNYLGIADGHNLLELITMLQKIKLMKGAKVLHLITTKGKGLAKAEKEQTKYHAISKIEAKSSSLQRYSEIFGDYLVKAARENHKIVAITPAMIEGSSLQKMQKEFPERLFDVGIAEQHSVSLAAGLALGGLKPIVAIYSTFLQRAYDQLITDVALQNLNVCFTIDRAGIVGEDGKTHNGVFDIAFLNAIPNLIILAPSNKQEMQAMLEFCFSYDKASAIRYPREEVSNSREEITKIELGKAEIIRKGERIAILVFGTLINKTFNIADKLNATLINMRFIKPFDKNLILELMQNHTHFITLEDGVRLSGVGQSVSSFIAENKKSVQVLNLGFDDEFVQHGSREDVYQFYKLDEENIYQQIQRFTDG